MRPARSRFPRGFRARPRRRRFRPRCREIADQARRHLDRLRCDGFAPLLDEQDAIFRRDRDDDDAAAGVGAFGEFPAAAAHQAQPAAIAKRFGFSHCARLPNSSSVGRVSSGSRDRPTTGGPAPSAHRRRRGVTAIRHDHPASILGQPDEDQENPLLRRASRSLRAAAQAQPQPARRRRRGPDPRALTQAQIKQAQMPSALYRIGAVVQADGDIAAPGLDAAAPDRADAEFRPAQAALASVYAEQDDTTKAYDVLVHMQGQGFGYDIARNPASTRSTAPRCGITSSPTCRPTPSSSARARSRSSCPRATICSSRSLTIRSASSSSSAACAKARSISSTRTASSAISSRRRRQRPVGVYALAVDAAHETLYVASTVVGYFKGFKRTDFGKAGIFEFELSTGKFCQQVSFPPDSAAHAVDASPSARMARSMPPTAIAADLPPRRR